MKSYIVLVLFAAAVAIQAKSVNRDLLIPGHEAEDGEAPWLVHLRLAHAQAGDLKTCAGALIDPSWVLTTAACLENARFIWVRFGAVDVISPKLVTETTSVIIHGNYNPTFDWNNIALVGLNRVLDTTSFYRPISIAPINTALVGSEASYCAYGGEEVPGETLRCYDVAATQTLTGLVVADGPDNSVFDFGTPLVHNEQLVGLLVSTEREYLNPGAYIDWIQNNTN